MGHGDRVGLLRRSGGACARLRPHGSPGRRYELGGGVAATPSTRSWLTPPSRKSPDSAGGRDQGVALALRIRAAARARARRTKARTRTTCDAVETRRLTNRAYEQQIRTMPVTSL